MKIHYSPSYDGDIFLGDSPSMMGEAYVGNMGLLQQLQLRAGVYRMPVPDVEREAQYHNAMMAVIKNTSFEKSADVDPLGVAKKLLEWRDALIMAGWDARSLSESGSKVAVLAEIEIGFSTPGFADCWKSVAEVYRNGVKVNDSIDSIYIECPWSEIPFLIQQTLTALKENDVEVIEVLGENTKEQTIQTDKFTLVEFEDVNDAYEWFAKIEKLPEDTAVLNRDNVQLNHTLTTWDKPLLHSSLIDSNPQLLQLFKLSMSIFSRPLNIQNLVSYLMLPMSPIPARLRRQLARQLLTTGGFGDKVVREDGNMRDDWEEIIETFEFLGKDGNDSPQAKGIARAKKIPFLLPIRKDYTDGIEQTELRGYIQQMKQWIVGLYAADDLPAERIAQLRELSTYFSSLDTALSSLSNRVVFEDIEKLILQIYRPMSYSLQVAECGSANVISDISALAKPAKVLLWLDCQDEAKERDAYDFLSQTEREQLTEAGCYIPSFVEHLKTQRSERLRLLAECEQVVLVRSGFNGTTRLAEHSMIAEVRQAFKSAGKEWKSTPADEVFDLVAFSHITKQIEVFQPQKYLELGEIAYNGRTESNTSLDTLINFPFNYVMQYVARLSMPDEEQLKNTFIATGLVAHSFVENIVADAAGYTQKMRQLLNDEFELRLNTAIDATGLIMRLRENASELTEFRKQLKESLSALIEIMEQKGWTPVGCEIPFPNGNDQNLSLDTIGNFGARIDFLLTEGDKYVIIDFKWSYSKKYAKKLEDNTAIQLELYRQTVKATYPDKDVAGVGYYLMPKKQLFTADFTEIPGSKLIKRVNTSIDKTLYEQIKNSYVFRMEELRKGHIEEAETMDVFDDADGYYAQTLSRNLCPLSVTEKTEGRGENKTVVAAKKNSEQVFKPSKKIDFEKVDALPSEIATSHPILKGRLK